MTYDDFLLFLKKRPLSWSAISSFEWDNEQWYRNYLLGQKDPPTKELMFGSYVDKKIQSDPTFLPKLTRYSNLQFGMSVVFNRIPLIGYADAWESELPAMRDYKTGKKPWDQKRADETGQLTMYALMTFIQEKIKPEDIRFFIDWMPTQENGDFSISFVKDMKIQTFETRRTMNDILAFGSRINQTVKDMHTYILLRQNPF